MQNQISGARDPGLLCSIFNLQIGKTKPKNSFGELECSDILLLIQTCRVIVLTDLSLIDSLLLFRYVITKTTSISKNLKFFRTNSKKVPVILKFSYAGNVQYHKLSELEVRGLIDELNDSVIPDPIARET